jgi:hypothetical protein
MESVADYRKNVVSADIREKGHQVLDEVPEEHLLTVVRWLELLAAHHPDAEPEELWLLATGNLKAMADEAETEARPLDDWRDYLDAL